MEHNGAKAEVVLLIEHVVDRGRSLEEKISTAFVKVKVPSQSTHEVAPVGIPHHQDFRVGALIRSETFLTILHLPSGMASLRVSITQQGPQPPTASRLSRERWEDRVCEQ